MPPRSYCGLPHKAAATAKPPDTHLVLRPVARLDRALSPGYYVDLLGSVLNSPIADNLEGLFLYLHEPRRRPPDCCAPANYRGSPLLHAEITAHCFANTSF